MESSVYQRARQEWDERYADLVLGKRNWQITAAGMIALMPGQRSCRANRFQNHHRDLP